MFILELLPYLKYRMPFKTRPIPTSGVLPYLLISCVYIILCNLKIVARTGHNVGLFCMVGHYLGPKMVAIRRSRRMAAKQEFLMYYSNDDAIGIEVGVRYRMSVHLLEVVVKRGFTVFINHYSHSVSSHQRDF